MKLLTLVVPCYNSQDYMERCVDSILVGGDRVEIVIIDDGSTDRTPTIADSYAEKYPNVVKVVHQENGGHGEGINAGLKVASGKFFKVVDSDDRLSDDFPCFLDMLETSASDADLVVNNYVYTYEDGSKDNPIRFSNVFPSRKIVGWNDTRSFNMRQVLMIHCCAFKTEIAKKYGGDLPKHIFYEDNLYVCKTLPHTDKLFFTDLDLYRYTIGRPGQSVAVEVMTKRYRHQILIADSIFRSCDLGAIKQKSKRLFKYLYHEMQVMYAGACAYAMHSDDPDYYKNLTDMWASAFAHDKKFAKKLRGNFIIRMLNLKGRFGKIVAVFLYDFTRKLFKFN